MDEFDDLGETALGGEDGWVRVVEVAVQVGEQRGCRLIWVAVEQDSGWGEGCVY